MQNHLGYKWLSFSLFSGMRHWDFVLRQAIAPITHRLTTESDVLYFSLELNYAKGDNIRLGLYAEAVAVDNLVKEASAYFENFFIENILAITQPVKIDPVFMHFPQNSVRYGLFNPNQEITAPFYKIAEIISKAMINVLALEVIDDRSIITMGVYLNLIWCRAIIHELFNKDKFQFYLACNEIMFYPRKQNKQILDHYFKNQMLKNRQMLTEIYNDIVKCPEIDKEVSVWVNPIYLACCEAIKILKEKSNTILNGSFNVIPYLINNSLGIDGEKADLLACMIAETIRENK